ncbi:MAG: type II CAAX endopeptidase family protein [Armatimonadota bacterium]|nr:type II CAAX endopeptidase family protein [Armatimonadota bacterium]
MLYHPAIGDIRAQVPRIGLIAAMVAAAFTLLSIAGQRAELPSERWYRVSRQQVMQADLAWHLGESLERVLRRAALTIGDAPWLLKERGVAVWERRVLRARPSHAAAYRLGVIYGHRGYPEQSADMLTLAASLDEASADFYHALAEVYSDRGLSAEQLREKARIIAGRTGWLIDIVLADCYRKLDEEVALRAVRERQYRRAARFLGGFAAISALGTMLVLVGVGTLVGLLRQALSLPRPRARVPFIVPWTVIDIAEAVGVLVFAMALGGWLLPIAVGRLALSEQSSVVRPLVLMMHYVLVSGLTIGVILYRVAPRSSHPLRSLGWRFRRALSLAGTGVAGYGVFVTVMVLVALVASYVLGQSLPLAQTAEEVIGSARNPAEVAIFFVLVCIMAPVFEELIFRGYVYGGLRRVLPSRHAIIIGGALFAAVHLNAEAFAIIGLIGVLLCYLYERTRSLLPGMIAHGVHNGMVLAVVLLQSM